MNRIKQKLSAGQVCLGTFAFEFNTTGIARIAATAGAEFIIYDMEHTGWSVETIRSLLATVPRDQIVPAVRVPATQYHFIARVLDMGSQGIMVPMVESSDQAQQIVQSAKYPPVGRRGAAFTIAHDQYLGGEVTDKIAAANHDTMIFAQIETATGLENVESIASVEGIDVLWIGQFDLTNSLGIPAQFSHEQFHRAVARVAQACSDHGKIAGMMAGSVDEGRWLLDQGFRCIAYGGDLWLYQQALRTGLDALRQLITTPTSSG